MTEELKQQICSQFLQGEFPSKLARRFKIPKVWVISLLQESGIIHTILKLNDKLSEAEKNAIVVAYKNGKSITYLSDLYNIDPSTVSRLLDKNGISKRSRSDYYKQDVFNYDYFKNIDTANKAYYLGFIMADGYNKKSKCLELSLHPQDRSVLEGLIKEVGSNREIKIKKGKYVYLSLFSKRFMSHLEKHGVVSNKSLILQYPNTIHEEFQKDFIRGYFDGDGYVKPDGKTIEILGTFNMISNISEKIFQNTQTNPSYILQIGNIWRLCYGGGKKTAKVYHYLYDDSQTFFERKNQRFHKNKYIRK